MAKKKAASKVVKAELIETKPEMSLKIELGAADVIAIAVSEIEQKLQAQVDHHTEEVLRLAKELQDTKEGTTKAAIEAGNKAVADLKARLEKALEGTSAEVVVETYSRHDTIDVVVCLRAGHSSISAHRVTIPVPSKVIKLREKCDILTDAHRAATEALCKAKLDLGRLPSYERQQRAKIARAQLETTTEGKRLLDAIRVDLPAIGQG